ncbi:MAG: hypothetical protein JWO38_6297 [Gemmataceae bacterium]|nr:hypothetical protein [Gemmataceae bacterium]
MGMTRVAAHFARQLAVLAEARPDGELLTAFLTTRDESAFAELVRRHGPLVWTVCRRLLPDPADAEDAFQAVFLVLVRRARQLTGRAEIGPWLYRVAVWTGRSLRRRNARRFARCEALSPTTPDPSPGPEALDLRADLDRALLSLPEKYRDPLILCHLQGWSRREAAARLGYPEGTLSSLLARGLDRLRSRLRDRDPAKALGVAAAAVPAVLASATVRAAAAARLATAGVISSSVSQLAEGVLHMLWVKKATAATFALVVVFGFGVGVGVSVREVPRVMAEDEKPAPERGKKRVPGLNPGEDVDKMLVDLTAELAENEAALQEAKSRVKLAREKLQLTEEAVERGYASKEAMKDAGITAKRAEEEVAKLEHIRAKLAAQIGDRASRWKAAKPAPPKPSIPPAADFDKHLDQLSAQVERAQAQLAVTAAQLKRLKDEQAAVEAAAKTLNRVREDLQLKMAELQKQKQRAEAEKKSGRFAPDDLAVPVEKLSLEVRIGTKDATWPFSVKEFGPDGKAIGSVACENVDVLARLLARAARDPAGPKEVQLTVSPGASSDLVQAAQDACRAAGIKHLLLTKPGVYSKPDRADPAEYERRLRLEEDLLKKRIDEQQWLDEKKLVEEARKKLIEQRNRKLHDEERKLGEPVPPAQIKPPFPPAGKPVVPPGEKAGELDPPPDGKPLPPTPYKPNKPAPRSPADPSFPPPEKPASP